MGKIIDASLLSKVDISSSPMTFKQLCVLVLDGSGSMKEQNLDKVTKGEAVAQAVRGLFGELQNSSIKSNFCTSIIYFDDEVELKQDITEVENLNLNQLYDPTEGMMGATYIYKGLEMAKSVVDRFYKEKKYGDIPYSAVIIIMSDGLDMKQNKTKDILNQFKSYENKTTIASCFFETSGAKKEDMDECKQYMSSLVSEPKYFRTVMDAAGLRKFMIESISQSNDMSNLK
jgi:uncharacterized protein YegL